MSDLMMHHGNSFHVEIDKVGEAWFTEVSGLNVEFETQAQWLVGPQGKHHFMPYRGNPKPGDVTFKKGVAIGDKGAYWKWIKDTLSGFASAISQATVTLHDYHSMGGSPTNISFVLEQCWPKKVTLPTLKAGANELVIEEITLTCAHIKPGHV